MNTQEIDPKCFDYGFEFNNLAESTREVEPPLTLRNDDQVRYEMRHIYDGAGNEVIHRSSNIDLDGSLPANDLIDRAMSFDGVNNLLSSRAEVDDDGAKDLITRYAYDNNDDQIITQYPEGNREFTVYDERRLSFKTFYGDNNLIFDLENDHLIDGQEDNSLNSGLELDTLVGSRDDDTLLGGGAFGGLGQNISEDLLSDGLGDDPIMTGDESDTLTGADSNNNPGRGEIDTLTGGYADNLFIVGNTNNVLYDEDVVPAFGTNDDSLITDSVNQVGGQEQIQLTRPKSDSQYFLGSVQHVSDRGFDLSGDVFEGIPLSVELSGGVRHDQS